MRGLQVHHQIRRFSVLCFSLLGNLFASSFAIASHDHQCPASFEQPVLRLQLDKENLGRRIHYILEQAKSLLEKQLADLDIPTQILAPVPGAACAEYSDKPSFDKKQKCLYLPALAMGESGVPLRRVLSGVLSVVHFEGMRINHLRLGNVDVQCEFSGGTSRCRIFAEVNYFEMQSNLRVTYASTGKEAFVAPDPVKVYLQEPNADKASIVMDVALRFNEGVEDSIDILPDKLTMNVPPSRVQLEILDPKTDILSLLREPMFDLVASRVSDFPLRATDREKWDYAAKFMDENKDWLELLDERTRRILFDYEKLKIVENLGNAIDLNVGQIVYGLAWEKIEPPLSRLIAKLIQDNMPVKHPVRVKLPIPTANDQINAKRHMHLISEMNGLVEQMSAQLDEGIENFGELRSALNQVHKVIDRRKYLEKIVVDSRSPDVLNVMIDHEAKLGKVVRQAEEALLRLRASRERRRGERSGERRRPRRNRERDRREVSSSRVINDLIENRIQVQDLVERISGNVNGDERLFQFKLHSLASDHSPGKIDIFMSGCSKATDSTVTPADFSRPVPPPSLGKGEYSFAAQIGIDVINKYLKTLFDRGYFQLCFTDFKFNEESKDCKELGFWGTRHRFGVKKAPYIGLDAQRGEHYIHIPEIERVSTVLMDVSLMNKCLSDVTNMSIRLRQSTAGGKSLINEDSLVADPDFAKNARRKISCLVFLLPFGHIVAAAGGAGYMFGHFLAQDLTLALGSDNIAALVNNGVNALTLLDIKEVAIHDGLLTIYGTFKDVNENKTIRDYKHMVF